MRTRARRALSVSLILAMMTLGVAVPAWAAAEATATLLTSSVFADTEAKTEIRVTNTASGGVVAGIGAGTSIDAVQIFAPQSVFDGGTVTAPPGWSGSYDQTSEAGFFFADSADDAIEPGASLDFAVNGDVLPRAEDGSGDFFVQVSDDGGTSGSSAGRPTLLVRTLEMVQAVIDKPASATNEVPTEVTAGQDNAEVVVTVRSHSNTDRNVTAAIAQAGGSSSIEGTLQLTQLMDAGDTTDFPIPVTFGNAGTLSLDASASTAESQAAPLLLAGIDVQAAFDASYIAGSFSPQAVVPGAEPGPQFMLSANKVGVQPAATTATLTFGDDDTDYVNTVDESVTGGSQTLNLTWPQQVVPEGIADGIYTPEVVITGADANGALIDDALEDIDELLLDRLRPVISITATPDEPALENATAAATDGWNITYSGDVRLGPNDDDDICTDCEIQSAQLVSVFSGGATESQDAVGLQLTNGQFGGNGSYTFPTREGPDGEVGPVSAYLEVTVAKQTGLTSLTTSSNTFEVDLVLPVITQATTVRDGDTDYVEVTFSEMVGTAEMRTIDWSVDNNSVAGIEPAPSDDGVFAVRLELSQQFADRNATPAVTYSPTVLSRRAIDRVSQDLLDQTITAIDGIVPEAPVIDTVAGMAPQPEEFFTNQSEPDIGLSNLVVGDVIIVYADFDGDGCTEADTEIARKDATGETDTVQSDPLGNSSMTFDFCARLRDDAGNFSPLVTEVLNLDFKAPIIIDAVLSGSEVTVTFDEPLPRGRNAAFDWTVFGSDDDGSRSRPVNAVAGTGETRSLTVESSSYTGTLTLEAVNFTYRGPEGNALEDRATNKLNDGTFDVATGEYSG